MIRQYKLHNFKNHADTTLNLSGLTLLTGMNGAGKSSVIQSLLLLRDTLIGSHQLATLYLRGDSFNVGQTKDAVNYNCQNDIDRLRYEFDIDDNTHYELCYRYSSDAEATSLKLESMAGDRESFTMIPLFTDMFQYLSAFRSGPQSLYGSDKELVEIHRQLSQKLGQGEMTAYYLDKFGESQLAIDALCYDQSIPHTLRQQTECWMNEISAGLQMKINQNGSNYEVLYGTARTGRTPIYYSAINTGYGISYVLSVVVAILSAKPGAFIMIENPEAHIHPAGQAALMRLISKAVANGVQVVIETHSDHIINGALVARKLHLLKDDVVDVYFFDRDDYNNAQAIKLHIGNNGMIQNAPERFFGQMNADLKVLFELD